MPTVLLFDVNETLLDLGALDPAFERAFGAAEARLTWFAALKELWLVQTATGRYDDFATLADVALRLVADRQGRALADADRQGIADGLTALPAHPEVADALHRLAGAGFRLAALTNGTLDAARRQLRHAGLADRFEDVFSADEVRRYKPAPEPYRMALDRLGVAPSGAWLVAAHAWDVAGAAAVGMRTAFVARPGKAIPATGPVPDLSGADLHDVAQRIIEVDRERSLGD